LTNVCFITPEYRPIIGGTGAYVNYLSQALASSGNNVYIVTKGETEKSEDLSEKIHVFYLKTFRRPIISPLHFYGLSFRKLSEINRRFNIDIAHANLPLTPSFAVPENFGKALVSTVHSTWRGEAEALKNESFSKLNINEKIVRSFNRILRYFESKMLERSDRIIAVSEFTKREILQSYNLKASKIEVIYNGVDVTKFKPTENKDEAKRKLGLSKNPIILYVGRLYSRKGLPALLKAASLIARKLSNVKLVISGKALFGEERKLRFLAKKLGVERNVHFFGYFPDEKLPKLYQAADVFAFPSLYENLPFALLEALSSGLPAVSTRIGGIPEIIQEGKNGFLIDPLDFNSLAEKIIYVLENPKLAFEIGLIARETVKRRFNLEKTAEQVLKVYDYLL